MKFLDKLALKIFSLITFLLLILLVLVLAGFVSISDIYSDIVITLSNNAMALKILITILVILFLLAIKGLFFTSKPEDDGKDGIVLENNSGKLVITKESLENLIASVTKDIPGAETIGSRTILDKNKNLIVYVTAVVSKDVMIKDVSKELQRRVKEIMMKTADLEVNEINIKIKNITSKKVKGLPAPQDEEKTTSEENTESDNSEETNSSNEETSDAE